MNAFAISSPLQRRISQDIHDLQAEIGREAARAYCACQLESPRFTETAPDGSVQDLSNLGPNCDLVFDDFINFPIEDCPAVEPCPSDGKSVSCEDDPTGATTSTVSGTLNGEPGCPSHGRPQKMIPVIQVDCLFRKRLQAFLNQYWHTLRTDGLFTQTPSQCIDLKDPERTRRLWDFSLLRTLRKDDDLRYLRRALALLCNLKNFEVFHQEAAHLRSCGHQPRLQHETDKQVAYNEYLAHICACETVPALRQARQALTGDLRFARRWLILTQPLTAGALLVCGESMCKKMSVEVMCNAIHLMTLVIARTPDIPLVPLRLWSLRSKAGILRLWSYAESWSRGAKA